MELPNAQINVEMYNIDNGEFTKILSENPKLKTAPSIPPAAAKVAKAVSAKNKVK